MSLKRSQSPLLANSSGYMLNPDRNMVLQNKRTVWTGKPKWESDMPSPVSQILQSSIKYHNLGLTQETPWETSFSYGHYTWNIYAMTPSTPCAITTQEILWQPLKWGTEGCIPTIFQCLQFGHHIGQKHDTGEVCLSAYLTPWEGLQMKM